MDTALDRSPPDAAGTLAALVATEGCHAHPHVARLLGGRAAGRDLADAVHALCIVHGRHPDMIEEANEHCAQPDACGWLTVASGGFAGERAALVQLTAAVGPLPSTPGQAESEAALAGIRHALSMLARSDRSGCATGAAAALVADWHAARAVMQAAARHCGIELADPALPSDGVTGTAMAMLGGTPLLERALVFGARQLLAQNRGLWDLLAARASARDRG
ncbi:hypothetical protein GCM10011380_24150 [Sphingomonas metalli]|uniref:Uncharacterized protein n=1 Tax=Sphingomonas metalli TaxID=1779358 RepID=A0A916WVG4_9SPHN|nr:hypothetical protein [Sphingomonas metalli]GGB33844.1 hypothetical protein GCM10011380_24150 [Sphingomonas metalli]